MPLYDIKCSRSEKVFERFIPLAKFEEAIICDCNAPAIRLISSPLFSVDQTSYTCPVTGAYVGSKRQHEENLKLTGCRVLETGEKELNEGRRHAADEALDKKVEDTVEREISGMGSDKRERLYNELVSHDLSVERK